MQESVADGQSVRSSLVKHDSAGAAEAPLAQRLAAKQETSSELDKVLHPLCSHWHGETKIRFGLNKEKLCLDLSEEQFVWTWPRMIMLGLNRETVCLL
jgi:hypothetical protein